ncbi:MAG: mechanosensitive ion channel family protein [Deltaproteobacteria bacterium]|nr:MAG: mechanosensitive ion channel family protein [Deltaproteobacteria bacterium]
MGRKIFISRLILAHIFLGFLLAGQPIEAQAPPKADTVGSQETVRKVGSKSPTNGQVAVQLGRDEIDSIAAALPEGEAKQMFRQKDATGKEKNNASSDEGRTKDPLERVRSGEEYSRIFFEGEKAFSQVQEQIYAFFAESTIDSREWAAALDNLNMGKGFGHLMLSFFVAALLIFAGLACEWLVRQATEGLRRQILDTASLGRMQFLGRVVSRLFLDILGLGTYILTTFVLFAVFYDEGDPGFSIASTTLLPSYYIRFFILAANLVLSPAGPALRLFPLQDQDAKFLFRWIIAIVITGIAIAAVSYMFLGAGISHENFLFMYSMSGLSVSLLVVVMIWRSRHRVARAIWSGGSARDENKSSLRAKIARTWHWFAMLYVIGMGGFWFIRGIAEGEGAILQTIISVFLIPLLIGIIRWVEHLLDVASGISPSPFISSATDSPETVSDFEATPSAEVVDQKEDKTSYLKQHLALIKITLRILLVALLFFLILRLWGIDLPVGRIFTSTALNIIGLLLLGFVVWQYTKARIDKKLREEMPDEDEEMEEGGSGGSRVGTLLVLLRKFILSVLFVIISLIILSSLGLDIGPLIAGAGVIGLAIGFGSQTLVKDILSGVFFLIDDAFRVGDFIETAGTRGMVEHISLRSVKLRHPRGMVFTIPFGDMGSVQNFSRDYIITKLDIRVRYDTDIDKIRKIIKRINIELQQNEEIGPKLLGKIKSQGVREMDDSAMILRVKFKTKPGEQFVVRRELYKRIQESFREQGIEFAYRNVTVYLPPEVTGASSNEAQGKGATPSGAPGKKLIEAGAAAAVAASQADEAEKKSKV